MAWTAPTTRATDFLVTASVWNTDIVDNLAWLKDPATSIATLAAQITTTSTSFTDATGLSVTMTTNGGTLMVGFIGVASVAGGTYVDITIDVDGVSQGATDGIIALGASGGFANVSFVTLVEGLSAGSHTIKVRWKVNGGTATMYADNSLAGSKGKPILWVRES
jgi:hypothetical protein